MFKNVIRYFINIIYIIIYLTIEIIKLMFIKNVCKVCVGTYLMTTQEKTKLKKIVFSS